jgi:hypothetical protein
MPPVYRTDCPYCNTKRVSFEYVSDFSRGHHTSFQAGMPAERYVFLGFFVCAHCKNGLVVNITASRNIRIRDLCQDIATVSQIQFIKAFPEEVTTDIPQHTPPNIENFFKQALDSMKRENWDSAGTMFRKTLDVTTKDIGGDSKKKLYDRIEQLANNGKITDDLKNWAHEIRDIGNDASHEDDPFKSEEAKDIHAFTDLFLRYVYTLSCMLEARRKKAGGDKQPQP